MTDSFGWGEPRNDRELTAEMVRDVVREQFPEIPAVTVEPMGEGWEHETYLVSSAIGNIVGIPRITRWGQASARFPHRFAGHDLVPGVGANDPSVNLNPALADDIGRVLARLNAIPPEAGAALVGAADMAKVDMVAGLRRVRHWVDELPEIRSNLPGPCAWLDGVRRVPDPYRGPPRFIHDDFQMDHVLVGRTTGRLSGIIDWGGGLGDPARDFSYVLIHGGWSFFQRAVDAYDLPLDAEFPERTLFSARLGVLHYLAYAMTHGGNTSRDMANARRLFELQ
jgi:aminoglycoside phosphotransferase (APT) family kinase protein